MTTLKDALDHGNIHLKNRLVMPPMATSKADRDGSISQAVLDYYKDKTKDKKIGLVILEHSYVLAQGQAHPDQISFANPSNLDGLKELVQTIHDQDAKVFAQLSHAGGKASRSVTGMDPVSASAVVIPARKKIDTLPKAMSKEEIEQVVRAFEKASLMAKEAGFDGVEIHSAHGYLLNQFYSPLTNRRTDEYGGDLQGRIRIHLEIIDAIRKAVGPDYPIALRLGAAEDLEKGSTLEDAVQACRTFEKAGVDLLDISGSFLGYVRDGHPEAGYFAPESKAVKQAVSVPVILTGGVKTAQEADALLEDECADFIGVGRALLADSDWPAKQMQ